MDKSKENSKHIAMASRGTDKEEIEVLISNNQLNIAKIKSVMKKKCSQTVFMGIIMVILAVFAAFLLYQLYNKDVGENHDNHSISETSDTLKSPQKMIAEPLKMALNKDTNFINIGMRNDYRLQDCQGSFLKRSFPDVDYSFLGYDILKGFPQADQHDPGFTVAIFQADYRDGSHTADCRYSVPRGLQILPDVSCDTSFSSQIIRNQHDLASSLSTSAEVSGGGWGVKFSASAGYKESSASMMRGEYVYITSQASCNYYYSKLIEDSPPPFEPTFLSWVQKLNTNNDLETYIQFFSTFGTHFLTETTFGARFVKTYKMATREYNSQTSRGVNVAVSASYSGLFSVGGGFSLDSEQSEAAKEFMSSVTSETKSVGAAPPANGDAMTWASTVQENPIPSGYRLSSIENLFTPRYMSKLSIDYNKISSNINRYKSQYCEYLKAIGKVESCVALTSAVNIMKTKIQNPYKTIDNCPLQSCEDNCIKSSACEAITYCTKCKPGQGDYRKCYMFNSVLKTMSAVQDDSYQTTLYRNTIMQKTAIQGQPLLPGNSTLNTAHLGQCNTLLKNEPKGIAFTYTRTGTSKCQIFGWRDIHNLYQNSQSSSTFLIHV